MTSSEVFVSRLPVGSSASMSLGSLISARAIATRCCWPPESWLGWWSSRPASPTTRRHSRAFSVRPFADCESDE